MNVHIAQGSSIQHTHNPTIFHCPLFEIYTSTSVNEYLEARVTGMYPTGAHPAYPLYEMHIYPVVNE